MSKHHAVEEEPQASDMSWIRGLARPEPTTDPSGSVSSDTLTPYYDSLVQRAPRHAADRDDANDPGRAGAQPAADAADATRTGPLRRVSAEQIDTLIGRLDRFDPAVDSQVADADVVAPDVAAPDVVAPDVVAPDVVAPDAAAPEVVAPDAVAPDAVASDAAEPAEVGLDRAGTEPERPAPLPDPAPDTAAVSATSNAGRGILRKPILLGTAAAFCLLAVGGATMSGRTAGSVATAGTANAASAATATKTIAIVVDGRSTKVSTLATSVAGVLASAGITTNGHDTLAPGVSSPIGDGATIVLNRGRLLTLTIDGQQRQIWTTARTVDEALAQLGTSGSDLALSANRSRAIPLTGLSVSGATLHTVAMSVGGKASQSSTTPAKTVGDVLSEHHITVGPLDTLTPSKGTRLSDGLVITVDRVAVGSATTKITLPQPVSQTMQDAAIVQGTSKVVQQGRAGSELITYEVTSVNGRQTRKTEQSRRTVVKPLATITHVGTKSSFTYVGSEVFTNDTSFGVNWDGLAMCESTHNPRAINADPVAGLPTYGMFQFDLPTWASVGGSGNPIDATPEEQLMRAKLLFQQRGLEPWACRDAAH